MKRAKITTKHNKPNETFTVMPSANDLTATFLKAELKKKKESENGGNNYLPSLEVIAKILIANSENGKSFSFRDFCVVSTALDIPADVLKDFFSKWTQALLDGKRLQKLETVYDHDLFALV